MKKYEECSDRIVFDLNCQDESKQKTKLTSTAA